MVWGINDEYFEEVYPKQMSKTNVAQKKTGRPDPILLALLIDEFKKLHNEHLAILKKIGEINAVVSPALENQIRRASQLALKIDRQVPDSPPET